MATEAKTRFKVWWRLVGSAVEHAAAQHGQTVDFKDLFLNVEGDDEESASLADVLDGLVMKKKFSAVDIAGIINNRGFYSAGYSDDDKLLGTTLQEFLFPTLQHDRFVSPKSAGRALSRHVGEPVMKDGRTLTLTRETDAHEMRSAITSTPRVAAGTEPPQPRRAKPSAKRPNLIGGLAVLSGFCAAYGLRRSCQIHFSKIGISSTR